MQSFNCVSGCTVQPVPLSRIRSAARVKLQQGLQHNTRRVYQGEQRVFQSFCSQYKLQPFPASEETLMLYVTYLDEHLRQHYASVRHHLAAIQSAHIALGMQNPLENCPRLHQLLHALPEGSSHCPSRRLRPPRHHVQLPAQGQASPLPQLSQGQSFMGSPYHGPLWPVLQWGASTTQASRSRSSPLHQGTRCQTSLLCGPASLHVHIFLASSKTDYFHQGCPVIIGCTRTPICRACKAWHLLQYHQHAGSSPEAPFFKINNRALDRVTLVNHIKRLATSLGLDSSRYSGHSLRIGGATSATEAGLSHWQIKLLGHWNSQAYQTYIKQDPLACADLAARMAAN